MREANFTTFTLSDTNSSQRRCHANDTQTANIDFVSLSGRFSQLDWFE